MNIEAFRKGLPIYQYKQRIETAVRDSDFLIVTGDTGSGKSTQLPQYMMDSDIVKASIIQNQSKVEQYGNGSQKPIQKINVIITQPRRMAAVSMASRVSYQRSITLGQQVGYTIRFDDKTSSKTKLRYITDGIFVRQCVADPYLFKYHVVILDQAHERSLYTDILFALIKKAVLYRKGTLKLIITSATLNTRTFSNYYGKCPVIQMHGKLFPVQVKYYAIKHHARVEQAVKSTIRMHLHEGPGDILVFLTGSQECESATRICQQKLQDLMSKGRQVPGMIMYQLYGALSNEDQARVFEKTPEGIRKVVFCTNIAETSLTIDNIGFVIDCGFVKQKTFNPKTNMDSLVTVPISKVQAIQRKGRAGRTQEGKCLRLYSEKFYEEMKDYSLPEILRVSLCSVMLTLKSMRINDVINFEYMQNPDKQAIFKALSELFLLQALNENGSITELGIQMSRFPLQPQYSKALITAALFQIPDRMITLMSMLSTQSIWRKVLKINEEEYNQYIEAMKKFLCETGDHQTLLNAYQGWMKCDDPNKYCDQNFLNFRALRQADSINLQLHDILTACNLESVKKFYKNDPNYKEFQQIKQLYKKIPPQYSKTLLRKCLSISFYFHTARISANQQAYILNYPQGTVAMIDPTSALALQGKDAQMLLYTELGGGSSHGIMRTVSVIDGKWIKTYLPKTKSVDTFRLAGVQVERTRKVQQKVVESEEVTKKRMLQQRQRKVKQAYQRYQARKKVKLE